MSPAHVTFVGTGKDETMVPGGFEVDNNNMLTLKNWL
jgi:pectate lyase